MKPSKTAKEVKSEEVGDQIERRFNCETLPANAWPLSILV